MHKHRTPHGLEQHALIDRALLQLLLGDEHQRPWAEDELARAVSLPGDVRDGLRRLRASRLIHRWNDLATASRPAVRFHEITQGVDPQSAHERRDNRSVLEYLLAGGAPLSDAQLYAAFSEGKRLAITDALGRAGGAPLSDAQLYAAFSEGKRLAITDALGRLDGDGLIERRGGRVIASEVAWRFDELMKL